MKIRQLALAILLPFVLGAADYYVSSTGNDDGDGSQNTPFKTLKHAFSKLKPGDTCFLQSGVYRKPLRKSQAENRKNQPSRRPKQQTAHNDLRQGHHEMDKVNGDIWIAASINWAGTNSSSTENTLL